TSKVKALQPVFFETVVFVVVFFALGEVAFLLFVLLAPLLTGLLGFLAFLIAFLTGDFILILSFKKAGDSCIFPICFNTSISFNFDVFASPTSSDPIYFLKNFLYSELDNSSAAIFLIKYDMYPKYVFLSDIYLKFLNRSFSSFLIKIHLWFISFFLP